MAKSSTPSYTVTRRIYPEPWQADIINRKMDLGNRMYNNAVRHYKSVVEELRQDLWFIRNLEAWKACGEDDPGKEDFSNEVSACISAYGLDEYDIHAYMARGKNISNPKGLGINIIQKLGTALSHSVRKAVFSDTEIHFRRHGSTDTLEEKAARSGIIYKPEKDMVSFSGMRLRLKPVRKKDAYLARAMQGQIKYCRIVREPFGAGYRYFLQIIMKGKAPDKVSMGAGSAGLDPGVSTMAVVGDSGAGFFTLAEGVEKYERAVRDAATVYERRRRLANPQNYNPDGTVKKDTKTFKKHWRRTKGATRALMELKSAYRKKASYIKNCHGYLSNRIVESCSVLIKEPMDYSALAKRARKLERQDKTSEIRQKDGSVREVRKYKNKKRFGSSIGRRSPAAFVKQLEDKLHRYGGLVYDVDIASFRASQYDHIEDTYKKPLLSDRFKLVGGHIVQRDLYSGFLLWNAADLVHSDRKKCLETFPLFLEMQEKVLFDMMVSGDLTGNFGLKDMLAVNAVQAA